MKTKEEFTQILDRIIEACKTDGEAVHFTWMDQIPPIFHEILIEKGWHRRTNINTKTGGKFITYCSEKWAKEHLNEM